MTSSGDREVDELFRRVIASMNAGRRKPIPELEHAFIRRVCVEAKRYESDLRLLGDEGVSDA